MAHRDGTALETAERDEAAIAETLREERARLLAEAGLDDGEVRHFERPAERPFTKEERSHTTLLFGGLTLRHDALIKAAMEGLGYTIETIPTPRKADFQAGKEYGNNGQCNPTYFTTGALVNYLKDLRDNHGVPTETILKDYVFATAGACGPCRFGMYEAEYRLALRNAGFDGFRVILFQQKGGLAQSGGDAGLEVNIDFAISLLYAIMIGDIMNELAYQVRPYETTPGQADRVFEQCNAILAGHLRQRDIRMEAAKLESSVLSKGVSFLITSREAEKIIRQLLHSYYTGVLEECRALINRELECDFTKPKPVCKITGEFWAQTTEGDGNFNMFRFLEGQGAEVLLEPVTTWLNYLIAQEQTKLRDEKGLKKPNGLFGTVRSEAEFRRRALRFNLASRALNREYDRIRNALGGTTHEQANQLELQRMGHPYYNRKSGGGEGHLEVAKNIYYSNKSLAHMVMSLKPFGCMPSAQSDGAQAAVTSHFPDMIYIPIETSGEGDVNAHSRAQMALGEAKMKCKDEFKACVERTGYALEDIRAFCAERTELRRPIQKIPHAKGVVGRAANFVLHVGRMMDRDPKWRSRKHAEAVC